jgi:hypothetical protein
MILDMVKEAKLEKKKKLADGESNGEENDG